MLRPGIAEPRTIEDALLCRAFVGNLCRCTGYRKIFEAVRSVASPARKTAGKDARR